MKIRGNVLLAAGVLVIVAGGGYGVGLAQGNQPHMQSALSDLQAAKVELQAATQNKAGHRVNAIGYVNSAITEVQAGIAAAG